MAESLRDAIAAALHRSQCERGDYGGCRGPADPEHQADAAEAEAAALGWFADWLRSDEARIEAEAASIGDLSDPLAALADALTKENPDG